MTPAARPAGRAFLIPCFFATALMLAACGLVPETEDPQTAAPATSPPAGAKAGTTSEATAMPEKTAARRPQSPVRPEPKPEKTYPPPAALDGLGPDAVTALLGRPRLKRRDEPAELWQYRTGACALDLFLYRDGDGGPYRVRHFEARPRDEGEAAAAVSVTDCFTSLLKAQEKRQAG